MRKFLQTPHPHFAILATAMTAYTAPHMQTLSPEVAARKAARRKIIARAHKLERDSYKAMMQKRRQAQAIKSS